MLREKLLNMLVCPEDRSPLRPAEPALLERINQAVAAGRWKNRAGQTISAALDAGLVRQDGRLLYPVIDNIPNMLSDEAIPLDQLPAK